MIIIENLQIIRRGTQRRKFETSEKYSAINFRVKINRLSFSLGYDIYDTEARMKADEYIAHLDRLMYEDKLAKRQPQLGQ
jgi:hypothetical protein